MVVRAAEAPKKGHILRPFWALGVMSMHKEAAAITNIKSTTDNITISFLFFSTLGFETMY